MANLIDHLVFSLEFSVQKLYNKSFMLSSALLSLSHFFLLSLVVIFSVPFVLTKQQKSNKKK